MFTSFVAFALACSPPEAVSDAPPPPPPVPAPSEAEVVEERFVQDTNAAADLLFVLDDSGSVEDSFAVVERFFDGLVGALERYEVDLHVGVITTDVDDPEHAGRLRSAGDVRFITNDTPDREATFAELVQVGFAAINERGFDATFLALETYRDSPENSGFYRPDAALHVFVWSDEPDQSETLTLHEFIRWFGGLKPTPGQATFNVLGGIDGDYAAAAEALDGQAINGFSQARWTASLDGFGLTVAGLPRAVFLSRRPVPATLGVEVDPALEAPLDWSYNPVANAIEFGAEVPPAGSTITVRYTPDTLSDDP